MPFPSTFEDPIYSIPAPIGFCPHVVCHYVADVIGEKVKMAQHNSNNSSHTENMND